MSVKIASTPSSIVYRLSSRIHRLGLAHAETTCELKASPPPPPARAHSWSHFPRVGDNNFNTLYFKVLKKHVLSEVLLETTSIIRSIIRNKTRVKMSVKIASTPSSIVHRLSSRIHRLGFSTCWNNMWTEGLPPAPAHSRTHFSRVGDNNVYRFDCSSTSGKDKIRYENHPFW